MHNPGLHPMNLAVLGPFGPGHLKKGAGVRLAFAACERAGLNVRSCTRRASDRSDLAVLVGRSDRLDPLGRCD